MKTVAKWFGIAAIIILALVIIALVAAYIYIPDLHRSWVKPGIAQKELPTGVDASVVFKNVTVIPMTVIPMDGERILEGQTVVIEDQRISEIGANEDIAIPSDALVVDGEGRYLIPGLSDMHMHIFGSENDLLVYLANGVTTIRTMGAESPVILEWRDQIRAGTRIGPSIWAWWPSIEANELFDERGEERSTRGGKTWVHTPEEAEQLVAEMAAMGVDGIKSHDVVSSEIYLALLASAAKHGLPFDGHMPRDHTYCPDNSDTECVCATKQGCWDDFRSMGVPAVAHIEELLKVVERTDQSIQQAAQDVADDGIWVTTSVYLMRSIAEQASDLEGMLAAMPEVKYVHPSVFDGMKWGPGANYYVEVGSRSSYVEFLVALEKMLLALNESGALLLSGTDAATPVMVPGFSLHDEFVTMSDYGMSPYDVLKTSTYNPAVYLGELDEFGTVEAGKRADLVLLEENPLEDIANTRQIAGVMAQGRYYTRADLDLMLEAVAQDYEAAETTQSAIEIAFPVLVILLLVVLVWFIVARRARRRKARQVSS
jgi:imidazolonepropionase-like amidohydrolase